MKSNTFPTLLVATTTLVALFSSLATAIIADNNVDLPVSASWLETKRLYKVPEELQGVWKREHQYFGNNPGIMHVHNDAETFFGTSLRDGWFNLQYFLNDNWRQEVFWNFTSEHAKWEVRRLVNGAVMFVQDLTTTRETSRDYTGITFYKEGTAEEDDKRNGKRECEKDVLSPMDRKTMNEGGEVSYFTCPWYYPSRDPGHGHQHVAVFWVRYKNSRREELQDAYMDTMPECCLLTMPRRI